MSVLETRGVAIRFGGIQALTNITIPRAVSAATEKKRVTAAVLISGRYARPGARS